MTWLEGTNDVARGVHMTWLVLCVHMTWLDVYT